MSAQVIGNLQVIGKVINGAAAVGLDSKNGRLLNIGFNVAGAHLLA